MLMKPDKKKSIASLIIGSSAPQAGAPEAQESKEEESQEDMGLQSAAEEIMSAIKSGDSKSLVEALKSFMDMCDSDYASEPSEEPPQ